MSSRNGSVYIGTSGWAYAHWRGPFYPEDLREKDWLGFYRQRFRSAEINNSFYQLPETGTLHNWCDAVGERFTFAVKASRYITHMKKLKEPKQSTRRFFDRIHTLGNNLGPILFQLPPKWKFNGERLSQFLHSLPDKYRYTFEFRDHSWFNDDAYALLKQYKAACCLYHLDGFWSPEITTAGFVYIRLHGPGAAYEGNYHKPTLATWADKISSWSETGKDVYCYFDNDQAGYAPRNAERLQKLLQAVAEPA